MPNRRDARAVRRLLTVVARRLGALVAIVPMLVVLLVTAPGVRLALRDAKGADFTTLRPAGMPVHVVRSGPGAEDRRAAAPRLEAASHDDRDVDETESGETGDSSDSNEPPTDQDDSGDGDGDEMIVGSPGPIASASLVAFLSHETPKLSGVIHSPEPRPARRA
jgi:hypothetical protein